MPYQNRQTTHRQAEVLFAWRCRYLLSCMLLIPVFLTGCDDSSNVSAPLRPVKTWVVPASQPAPALTWTGTLEPAEVVTLQFRLEGKLDSKLVDVGTRVKKNQVVATLSGSQSTGEIAASLAELRDAVAAEQKGRQELERTKKLYAIGTVSKAQLEEASAALTTLQARKIRARAQKDSALNNSDFSSLKAPFDGVVTAFKPYPGQNITSGQDIIQIASENAEVQFNLSSAMASSLNPGDKVTLKYGKGDFEGRIRFVNPQLDVSTLTSRVRVTFTAPLKKPIFGSPVSVVLTLPGSPVFALPSTALTRLGSQPAVFIVDKNGRIESRAITVARFSADQAFIASGLKTGEKVVVAGVGTLESGVMVRISTEAGK